MGNIASTLRKNGGCFGDCAKLTSKQKNDILKKRLGIKEKQGKKYRDSLKEKQNFYKEKLSAIDSQHKSLFESLSASKISREKKKRLQQKNNGEITESVKN